MQVGREPPGSHQGPSRCMCSNKKMRAARRVALERTVQKSKAAMPLDARSFAGWHAGRPKLSGPYDVVLCAAPALRSSTEPSGARRVQKGRAMGQGGGMGGGQACGSRATCARRAKNARRSSALVEEDIRIQVERRGCAPPPWTPSDCIGRSRPNSRAGVGAASPTRARGTSLRPSLCTEDPESRMKRILFAQ